ncbi:NUDIX hydrolase [Corynebacterium bouchesdurhonense]|uniref:NUDIX hydrolase n=1 Tax=Corynebacterium bouchesdurhonense TaxID=1720192 RepID=UPI000A45528A|nr:NUDIX hydrolase [Corynebacterium bouchesdurhonense]
MNENTRPVPGPADPRERSQGEQRRADGGGSGGGSRNGGSGNGGSGNAGGGAKAGGSHPKRRRRRGRGGKGRNPQRGGEQRTEQSREQRAERTERTERSEQRGTGGQRQGGSGASGGGQRRRRSRGRGPSSRGGSRQQQQRRQHQYQDRYDSSIDTRDETSAGGLVVSGMAEAVGPNGDVDLSQIYAALIGRLDRRGRLLWSMPKGHVEDGEHQWRTAEREVWEETGISGEAFDTLGTIDYWFVSEGVRIHKTVHHNLLRFVDGELNDEDPEVTEVSWVPLSELIERLAYADERKLARIAVDRMPDLARKEAEAGRATPR